MSKTDGGFVYILASEPNGTLYVGVTNDIVREIRERRGGQSEGFADHREVSRLVHVERFDNIEKAIRRENEVKGWTRERRLDLIRSGNPRWHDRYAEACDQYAA